MEKKENLIKNVLAGLIGKKVSSEMELSREEVVRLLKTTPEALDAFERAYKREVLNNPDESRMFGVSAKQMHEKNEDYVENQPDLNSLMCKIVKELLAQTKVWEYKKIGREPFELNASFEDKSGTSVTTETLNAIPRENRPQLAGDIILRTGVDEIPTSQQLLYWYSKAINEDLSEDERMMAYSMFREGLDLLDLDEISYRIIGENQVSMGYWLPKIAPVVDYDGFFKIPNTKIMKVPLPVLQLTFAEYSTLTRATLDIVNELCMRAFRLRTDADYFIKTGVFSSKFDFRNARVHDPKEIREMGEYFLFVHNMSRNLGFMSYGVATTNEWVVREFIPDKEDNLTIYHGLPLHTEYRVFVDFDTKEVLGIHPYWDPDVMKIMIANTAAKSKAAENIAISPKELKKLAMCRKSFEFSRMGLTYDGTKEVLFSVKAVNEVKKLIMAGKENVEGAVRTFYEGFSPDWFSCDAEFMSAKENSMKRILRLYEYIQTREVENIRTDVFYENNFVRTLNYRGLAIKTIRGKFDFVFQDKTGKTVCVILHYGKPTESSKARKPENLPENSPELLVATSAARNSIAGDFSVELWYLRGKDDNGTVVAPKFEHRPEKNVISADFTKESTEKLLTRMVSVLARAEKRDCSNCMHKDVCKTDGVIRKTESECTTEKASVKEITLTESQQEVVNHVNGPMCVVAVPGAGKTASLVARMMHLIKDVHVKPGKILFVSFTKKAAKEIRDRVEVQLSQYGLSGRPQIMTYNALGFSILKENPLYVGRRIKLAEDLDRYDLIFKALTKEPKIEKMSYLNPKGEHGLVRFLDGKFEEIYERGEESFRTQYMERYDVDGIIRVYRSYKAMYDAEGYIDYDDQISMVNELFDEYSVLSQRYAEKYEYIMVDEFQDSSQEQVDMIYSIARCHGNIVVSGDDDQSIYKFRGGSSQFMLEFEDDFPGAKVLYMEDNFRSNGKILRLCEALINGNEVRFQKVLRAHVKGESQPVYLKDVQPTVVRDTVKKALESGYKPGDIAILARNNKRLDEITMILDGVCPVSIPKDYMIEDTVFRCIYDLMTLYYRGMDMDMALYRMLKVLGITEMQKTNRFDSLYENLVQSGQIAKVSLTPECLEKYSREITPLGKAMYKLLLCFEKLAYGQLHEALAFIIKECFGIDRHLVVDDLVEIAEERGIVKLESLYQVMKEMIAFGSNERVGYDSREDAVNLLTCHDSKGKEFPVVIIYGMEDFDVRSEEETRVLYVAMSRAKEHLYMVETAYNRFGGFERISPYCTVAGGR